MTCTTCRIPMERLGRATSAGWEFTLWQCPKCRAKEHTDSREVNR